LKVAYLNPFGSTGGGGVSKADASTRKSIANRLGSKLRAISGPAQAPAKPSAPPALPPAKPKAAPPAASSQPPAAKPTEATMEQAWEEFTKHCPPPKWDQQAIEAEWFRILADLFPGKQPDELSAVDWGTMRDRGPSGIIPF